MRKQLMVGVASAALFAATSAYADVTVTAVIDKTKDITVTQTVTITKTVTADATVIAVADKFAEADALVNQSNHGNRACENCAEKTDIIGPGSINGNAGYVSVNQSAGNMNNQANAVSAAIDSGVFGGGSGGGTPPPPSQDPGTVGFAEANASVQQINGGFNSTTETGATPVITPDANTIDSINILFRDSTITASINGNRGVVQVNQATGQMNNQSNTLALAFSLREGGVALSEADLGQFNQNNFVGESDGQHLVGNVATGDGLGIHKSASINGSINGNIGIIGVNQAAGNLANQANVVSFAAVLVPAVTP